MSVTETVTASAASGIAAHMPAEQSAQMHAAMAAPPDQPACPPELLRRIDGYLSAAQVDDVVRAYRFAEQAHEGQWRQSGDAYITHPLAVACILADMHMDHQCLMAALLHDVIEDTGVTKHALHDEFDEAVADIVDGVSKLQTVAPRSRAEAQAANFQKMALAMAKDMRVIMVKLADRLHNMRTLQVLDPVKRRRIAKETLEIYAPIALRLGMNNMRIEFEELGFRAMHPMRSKMIKNAVEQAHGHRCDVISEIRDALQGCLDREGIEATVTGREKHHYSIYKKMRDKGYSLAEIMDIYGFRVIVDTVDTCYRVLGALHNLYKPVARYFKDYVAIPKANGYQSLHTVLFGMHGLPIEIQIRTHEMEAAASHGIAAHWLYKVGSDAPGRQDLRALEWVNTLPELQQRAGNSMEFIENVKIDLSPDDVYVFTPQGKTMALPQGATPIDFAYAVHTDIGNSCVSCRIERKSAPLSTVLESDQTVEINTAPGARPDPAWLDFVVTGKARSGIRHALKHQRRSESIDLGRRLLEQELQRFGLGLAQIADADLQRVATERKLATTDELLEAIGLGNLMGYVIAPQLLAGHEEHCAEPGPGGPLAIRGGEGLAISYADCCKPIPGDPIVGHVSAGRGIVIHVDSCRNIADSRQRREDMLAVRWDTNTKQEFNVELRVEVEHERGIIATLAAAIANEDVGIEHLNMAERDARLSIVTVSMAVRGRVQLAQVIRRIRKLRGVNRVGRTRG